MDAETKKIIVEDNDEGKFDFLYQLAYEMFADEKKEASVRYLLES